MHARNPEPGIVHVLQIIEQHPLQHSLEMVQVSLTPLVPEKAQFC